jgi:MGT family glycosyltransferase
VPFDFSRLDGRPLIYASMGSLQNQIEHVFETIAEATAGLDAQVVLSYGSADADVRQDLPGAPITAAYAPQLDLIERASVVVTHAGMNTAMESLACGVPMVAVPVTNDQPGVAARIAWTGTGEVLPFGKLKSDRLRALVRRVLEDGSYRESAARLQQAIRAAGGVPRAAEITERALTTNRPVPAGA